MRLTKDIKGKIKCFNVSNHAFQRFWQRTAIVHKQLQPNECISEFVKTFELSRIIKIKSKAKKIRDLMRGDIADYYRYKDMNFIVVNGTIVTVEFGGNKRYLNKRVS